MPNSLRSKLSKLRYKRRISDEEYKELLNKLNGHDKELLAKIRAEVEQLTYYWCEVNPKSVIDDVLQIIDKYKVESEVEE